MMKHHRLPTLAVLAAAALAVTGCTTGPEPAQSSAFGEPAETTTPPATSNAAEEYRETVENFPYNLAPNFQFPTEMPTPAAPSITDIDAPGSEIAFALWRCGLVAAAWEAEKIGDEETTHELIEQAAQATDNELPGNSVWSDQARQRVLEHQVEAEAAICEGWIG
ncbi:hypothetical protein [Agrococcus casei]|uniref:hypothetical protein n=1 Tax=Agrococcus casei TaxID=343512 RepID=UPI003F8F1B27